MHVWGEPAPARRLGCGSRAYACRLHEAMADAPAEPARKKRKPSKPRGESGCANKRYPSTTCGEPGCDKKALSGDRWQGDGYRCIAHGGGTQCTHVDPESGRCPKAAHTTGVPGERLCAAHSEGRVAAYQRGLKPDEPALYEWIKRLKRGARLRKKHLWEVWARQDYRCADPMRACYQVKDGKATTRCPWKAAGWTPSLDQVQLDHIKPLSQGGTNDPSNLQALCACCHAAKTACDVASGPKPAAAEPPECPPCM